MNVSLNTSCILRSLRSLSDARTLAAATLSTLVAVITAGAFIPSVSAQPALLQEPNLTGLFTIGPTGASPVLRDAARGWSYFNAQFGSANVEGVSFAGLFRVSDSGLADTQWRVSDTPQFTEQYLTADGSVIGRAYVKDSPTYEKRWYRLQTNISGPVTPVEISSLADLPPRDSVDLTQNGGLDPRPLPLADGSLVTYEVAFIPEPTNTYTVTLRKRDRQGNEQWSYPVGGRAHNLAADASGRVYLLGEGVSIGGKTANLLRLRSDGSVDTAWTPDIEIASNVSSVMRVVSDRIVIADTIGGAGFVYRLTTFDLVSGRKLTQRFPQYGVGGIADDGIALSAYSGGYWALLDSTRSDTSGDRVSTTRIGVSGYLRTSVPWRGGYVVGGDFSYWFDGKLYRHLMRLNASFRPDPTWTPAIDDAVAELTTDREGRLLVASNSVSGAQARISRFNADGSLDTNWQAVVKGDVYKLLAAGDGMLFVGGAFTEVNTVKTASLMRFRADDTVDQAWGSGQTWPTFQPVRWGQFGRSGIFRILDAGSDGVIFIWEFGYMNGSDAGIRRVSRSGNGAELSLPGSVSAAPTYDSGGGSMLRDPKTGDVYAIATAWVLTSGAERGTALVRMVSPSLNVDPAWTTLASEYGQQFLSFAYQSDSHVYVCRGYVNAQMRRIDKITGREDPNWSSSETFLCGAESVERRADGSTLVFSSGIYGPLVRYSATASNTAVNVVEYYSRDAKRFFITGRANEISGLDAMPTVFVRTGMTFAAETALVRTNDVTRTPICRFYTSPDAGGSNSHFYGREADCTLLKRFPALRYEGFDFRTGVPANGVCPASLPTRVFRLFNNLAASNNGNHRYVVTQVRRSEMVAAGWVDEGVAFCTASAVDSRDLAQIR